MAQQFTHITDPGTIVEQMGRKRVAKLMRRDFQSFGFEKLGEDIPQLCLIHIGTAFFEEIVLGHIAVEVQLYRGVQCGEKRELPNLIAFPSDLDPLLMNIFQFQTAQFTDPQPQPVKHHNEKFFPKASILQYLFDILLIDWLGQCLRDFDRLICDQSDQHLSLVLKICRKRVDGAEFFGDGFFAVFEDGKTKGSNIQYPLSLLLKPLTHLQHLTQGNFIRRDRSIGVTPHIPDILQEIIHQCL